MAAEQPPQEQGSRGPYRAGRERRREILQAATEVFAREGYRGGSLREMARAIGVTAGAILHHFGSKDELLVAVLEDRDVHNRQVMNQYLERQDTVGSLRAIVAETESNPGLARLFTTLSAEAVSLDHPAHTFFVDRYAQLRDFIASQLDSEGFTFPNGESSSDVAAVVLATMDGLELQWLLQPSMSMVNRFDQVLAAHGLATGVQR